MVNKKLLKEAEILDHFLDDLIRDSNASSPYGEKFDPEIRQLLLNILRVEQGKTQDVSEVATLRERIWRRVVADSHTASRLNRRVFSKNARIFPSFPKSWQWMMPVILVLVVILIGLYVLIGQSSPASAQEIIEKAYSAVNLSSAGMDSFTLTEIQRAAPVNARMNALNRLQGDEQIWSESKRWYEAPNRWRVEFRQKILAADGQEISSFTSIEVSDGTTIWYYLPEQKTVVINRFDPAINGKGSVALFGGSIGDWSDFLQQATTCYEPKISGSDLVAGRKTYVIDMGTTKCPSASAPEMNGRLILWIDRETFFILKQEQYHPDGKRIIMTSEVTQIEYNVPLDSRLFSFTPPADTKITDNRPKPAPSVEEFNKQLWQLAQQVDFPIFAPSSLPQGLKPRQPRLIPSEGNFVELAYVPPEEVEKDTLAEGNGILIQQQKATNSLVSRWSEGAEPVTMPKGKGWLRRGQSNPDGTGTSSAALMLRDGTLISISSFAIAPDELLKIASSLEPVPGSHPPLPNPTPPTLSEIREQVLFSVFVPTYLPKGLVPGSITGGESPTENVEIKYLDPNGAVGLYVLNGNLDCCPGLFGLESEEIHLPNGITAHLIHTSTTIYGGATLWWEQEGTHIELSGPRLTEEELIKIAISMSKTADLGTIVERMPIPTPTQPVEMPFEPLLPTWLPEEATRNMQIDGEIVTIGFDSHPNDPPHSVLLLVEMPAKLITPGGAPDSQASWEQIGGFDVMVIRRGENCITFEWRVGDLYLQLTNPYDPPGHPVIHVSKCAILSSRCIVNNVSSG